MSVYDGLIDDAGLLTQADLATVVARHPRHPYVAALVVPDSLLGQVDRVAPQGLPACVVNSGGAGGLLALARRRLERVRVVAVESALRDLDSLADNATRVSAAAAELDEAVRVFVGLPPVRGWQRAVDVVESAGHAAKVMIDDLAVQGPVLVDADLPFKVGSATPLTALQLSGLAAAILEIVDGSAPDTAPDTWDATLVSRLRRRLERVDLHDLGVLFSAA